ncbi:hypothetical protein [Actibacterium mucosum]|nr:hypothetical protein [Actibacterium mucosum]
MKSERRWLKSVLNESKKPVQAMPWARKSKRAYGQQAEKRRAAR